MTEVIIMSNNDLDNIIVLNDMNGYGVKFELLDLVEYKSKEYLVLLPVDSDDGEVVIFMIENISDEEESYVSVEDEETLSDVFEIFKNKFKDEFNFED